MYKVSNEFRTLIASGAEQTMLILFGERLFLVGNDFSSDGAELQEYFNTETDITIGEAPSSLFSCSVMNLTGLFNEVEFGEGRPFIGALRYMGDYTVGEGESCFLAFLDSTNASHEVLGRTNYFLFDEETYSLPQEAQINGLVQIGDSLYVYSTIGRTRYDYDTSTETIAEVETVPAEPYMIERTPFGLSVTESRFSTFFSGKWRTYLSCPLGVFDFDVTSKHQAPIISLSGYDRMVKFDVDATDFIDTDSWVFPTTLGAIFEKLCQYIGVPFVTSYPDMEVVYDVHTKTLSIGGITADYVAYKLTLGNVDHSYSQKTLTLSKGSHTFTNADMQFTAFPTMQNYITCRQILGYIAEASGNVARFNRNGELELRWYGQLPATKLLESDILLNGYDMAEYVTPRVDAIHSLLADGTDYTEGSGDNVYTILANSFLAGDSTRYAAVLTKLQSVGAYAPTVASIIEADPSIEAGDIVTILGRDVPLMSQTIKWRGTATAVYSSAGLPHREIPSSLERNDFIMARNLNEAKDYADTAIENYDTALNQLAVFNKLTNNGTVQGLVYDPATGNLYINASYIATGVLASPNGEYSLDMATGTVNMANAHITGGTVSISTSSDDTDVIELNGPAASSRMTPSTFIAVSNGSDTFLSADGIFHSEDIASPVEDMSLTYRQGLVFSDQNGNVTAQYPNDISQFFRVFKDLLTTNQYGNIRIPITDIDPTVHLIIGAYAYNQNPLLCCRVQLFLNEQNAYQYVVNICERDGTLWTNSSVILVLVYVSGSGDPVLA